MAREPSDRRGTINPNLARDHLANERTLLAWARTCIAIMGLGFVVARFGLLVRELGAQAPRQVPAGLSTAFGTALVACGAVVMLLAAVRYWRAGLAIDRNEYRWSPLFVVTLAGGVVAAAALLAIYLVITA